MLQAELFDAKMGSGDWTPHDSRTASGINNAVLRALKDLGLKGNTEKVRHQKIPDWIDAHVRALAAIGGAPQLLVPDNTKTAVCAAETSLRGCLSHRSRNLNAVLTL